MSKLSCQYCQSEAKLADSVIVYGRSYGPIWICSNYPKCDSYVGCHKDTNKPLGTLANRELREWRKKAKEPFNRLWKEKIINKITQYIPQTSPRSKAYMWLTEKLDIPGEETHFGLFDIDQCKKVFEIVMSIIEIYGKRD